MKRGWRTRIRDRAGGEVSEHHLQGRHAGSGPDRRVLTSLRVSCAGSIRVVLADTPVSLSAMAAFTERDVEIPQEVVDALVK